MARLPSPTRFLQNTRGLSPQGGRFALRELIPLRQDICSASEVFASLESRALLKRQGEMEKPMSMLGTLLVLLIVSVVLLFIMIGVIFDRVAQHKQETLRRKRETAQRRSATV